MNLGETISRLRSEKNMSQGDLADMLDVSRQSVSRWETNSAVPELDKLVKLSGIFGVTLDELVLDKKTDLIPENTPAAVSTPQLQSRSSAHKVAGTILLCMGFLIILAGTMQGSFPAGLLYSSPFLLGGIICFVFRQHIGLWCGWAVYFFIDISLRNATGINWRLTLYTLSYKPSMNYMRLFTAWGQLLCMILLIILTVIIFRNKQINLTGRKRMLYIGGWILFAILQIPVIHWSVYRWLFIAFNVFDCAGLVLFTWLLVNTVCCLRRAVSEHHP